MGIIPQRTLSIKDVSSGPRPLDLASLQLFFQSVCGYLVSHFSLLIVGKKSPAKLGGMSGLGKFSPMIKCLYR